MAGILKRTNFNALVDDDGTGTIGTIWNKSQVQNIYDDPAEGLQFTASTQTFSSGSIRLNSNILQVSGGSSGIILYDDDGATARVTMDGSGNVGVGKTPVRTLDVNGQVQATVGTIAGGFNAIQAAQRTLGEVYDEAVGFAVMAMEG